MQQIFYVYEIEDRNVPYITSEILPDLWIREVRKFAPGRASKRETIRRVLNVVLDEGLSTAEIDAFVAKNVYNGPKWANYISARDEIDKELVMREFKTNLIYTLKIDSEVEIKASEIKFLPKR